MDFAFNNSCLGVYDNDLNLIAEGIKSVLIYSNKNIEYFKDNNVYLYFKESQNIKQLLGKSNVDENLLYEGHNELEKYLTE